MSTDVLSGPAEHGKASNTREWREPRVAIIGAGVSGICMGVELEAAGIHDFVIYEKATTLGGVWRDNTYPGLFNDTPSRYYSYSFAPNPDWSRVFSPSSEIRAYLQGVARDFGVDAHVQFGVEVDQATWTPDGRWSVRTTVGEEESFDFVVAATGVLRDPKSPDIAGLDKFAGSVFHSAEWDHSVPLDARRVGVIGNGSTGVQLTRTLASRCAEFKLFQRTPQWILPTVNPRYSRWTRALLRRSPMINRIWGRRAYRFWRSQMELIAEGWSRPGWTRKLVGVATHAHLTVIHDRKLRDRLRPSDQPGCKRLVLGSGFYQAFNKGHAELVDTRIDHVEPTGIVTDDGELHELDVIVLATGFHAQSYIRPVELIGPDDLRLSQTWDEGPRGYRTVAVAGFPNFFMLIGPHSPIGNQAITTIAETQVAYVLKWIEGWRQGRFTSAIPRVEAAEAFTDEMVNAFPGTVWASGCDSYYLDQNGSPLVWPYPPREHRKMLAKPVLSEWQLD